MFKRLSDYSTNSILFFILVTFVILTVFLWRDYSLLFQSPLAVGIDGYFYVLQVDSIVNNELYIFRQVIRLFYIS